MPSKLLRFFVPCDRELRQFYTVEIHPTKRSMLREVERLDSSPRVRREAKNSRAICLRYTLKNAEKGPHEPIGSILFVKGDTPIDVVVHELVHAVIGWARRQGVSPVQPPKKFRGQDDPEERFATAFQFLFTMFYRELARATGLEDKLELERIKPGRSVKKGRA